MQIQYRCMDAHHDAGNRKLSITMQSMFPYKTHLNTCFDHICCEFTNAPILFTHNNMYAITCTYIDCPCTASNMNKFGDVWWVRSAIFLLHFLLLGCSFASFKLFQVRYVPWMVRMLLFYNCFFCYSFHFIIFFCSSFLRRLLLFHLLLWTIDRFIAYTLKNKFLLSFFVV